MNKFRRAGLTALLMGCHKLRFLGAWFASYWTC